MTDICSILSPLTLQYIKKLSSVPFRNAGVKPTGSETSNIPETRVLIEVQGMKEVSGKGKGSAEKYATTSSSTMEELRAGSAVRLAEEEVEDTEQASVVVFDCPVFILQFSSRRLTSMISHALLVKFGSASDKCTGTTCAGPSSSISQEEEAIPELVHLRLPFPCQAETFETVALYMEHFYGVNSVSMLCSQPSSVSSESETREKDWGNMEVDHLTGRSHDVGTKDKNSRNEGLLRIMQDDQPDDDYITPSYSSTKGPTPTVLEPPLKFFDLYHLQPWEVAFVWQRLLDLPSVLRARLTHPNELKNILFLHKASPGTKGGTKEEEEENPEEPASLQEMMMMMMDHFYFQSRWVDALGAASDTTVTSAYFVRRENNKDGSTFTSGKADETSFFSLSPSWSGSSGGKKIIENSNGPEGDREEEIEDGKTTPPIISPTSGIVPSPVKLFFSIQEKQWIAHRILAVLEASSQLQIEPLQSLCAALLANMIVDLDEDELRIILCPPRVSPASADTGHRSLSSSPSRATTIANESSGRSRVALNTASAENPTDSLPHLPPLTPERVEYLYRRYPWGRAAFKKDGE